MVDRVSPLLMTRSGSRIYRPTLSNRRNWTSEKFDAQRIRI